MAERPRPTKFKRKKLAHTLDREIFNSIVKETESLLERRFTMLAEDFDDISKTNFNPLLLLIVAPVYNIYSPFEIAERLQLQKAFHGDDTAFGKFAEAKILPLFGAKEPLKKKDEKSKNVWSPIDCEIDIEGKRHLFSLKSGPWTMNQTHAAEMHAQFPVIHEETKAPILIGIFYGRYGNLNNKPELVRQRLGDPDWFDYLVGKDFWEFVTGVKDVHKEIFQAIRKAQKAFGEKHKDETFHEKLVSNRLKIAASLRKSFDVDADEDFWETLFNNMF